MHLTVRVDIEDRNFHSETKRNDGADFHFFSNTHTLPLPAGFYFVPAPDRQLRVFADTGEYHAQPEWCENIPHPVEQTRGQTGSGDAYSPGWFELPLAKGKLVTLTATVEMHEIKNEKRLVPPKHSESGSAENGNLKLDFAAQLAFAARQFVVRRDDFKTVIAGYPWFLDWGRDSLICARGLLAAGMADEVKQILLTFAKFEQDGTLPNTINGNDVSNRDTTDAPLWFAVVCEDLAEKKFYKTAVDKKGRTIAEVLTSIAENYAKGTPNGIHMDADSALIWSPSHFTWMDTNYPAGTPREGYPVEIQVLWIRLLRQLENISGHADAKKWRALADHATASFRKLFWLEEQGWFADVLLAKSNVIARDALPMMRCEAIVFLPSASDWSPANARNAALWRRKNISSCRARSVHSRPCPSPYRWQFIATASSSMIRRIRIGRATRAMKTRAANRPTTTEPRGPGRSRPSARRWRRRGNFHPPPSPPPKAISAAWKRF